MSLAHLRIAKPKVAVSAAEVLKLCCNRTMDLGHLAAMSVGWVGKPSGVFVETMTPCVTCGSAFHFLTRAAFRMHFHSVVMVSPKIEGGHQVKKVNFLPIYKQCVTVLI